MRGIPKTALCACAALAACGALAVAERPVGADGLDAAYATDAYPGFDPIEDRDPEFKEKGFWSAIWNKVSCGTPEAQLDFARALEEEGKDKTALKAYEALVREWPASAVSAEAQLRKAELLVRMGRADGDFSRLSDAFEEYDYLIYYYPGLCDYLDIASRQYVLAQDLLNDKKTFFGIPFASNADKRRRFECIVRRAPGESWVPDAMLTIGDLRVKDKDLAEAGAVYGNLVTRFPDAPQARTAQYLACKCQYDLVNRNAYNAERCRTALNAFKAALVRYPDLEEAGELREWIGAFSRKMEDDAWERAVFYDTRQRTKNAAVSAYESFLAEFPDSTRRAEAEERIKAIKSGAPALRK